MEEDDAGSVQRSGRAVDAEQEGEGGVGEEGLWAEHDAGSLVFGV